MRIHAWTIGTMIALVVTSGAANPIDDEAQQMAACTMLFASAMNTSALQSAPGGVRFWSLQYGRAYITYSALRTQRGIGPNEINNEMAKYVAKAGPSITRTPIEKITKDLTECQTRTGLVFSRLHNSGFKFDKRSNETLLDLASDIASGMRKDLGY